MEISDARRILFCLRYGIGDVVMELPVLETLRRLNPHAHIVGLGAKPALELLAKDPRINETACVQDFGLTHWGDWGSPGIGHRIQKWLANQAFDLILDPSHAVIAVREAIWAGNGRILDSSDPTPALREGKRGVAAIKAAVRGGWGMEVPSGLLPSIRLRKEDRRFADQFLQARGLAPGEAVGLSPVASSHLKRWSVERFARLADTLTTTAGCRILLFCGPQVDVCRALLGQVRSRDRIIPVGLLDLCRVAALLGRLSFFIGNDTGLMHMAAAVETPVIAIFGPTAPNIYLPQNENAAAAVGDIPCPIRKTTAFGPSECIVKNRCLIMEKGCIHSVDLAAVLAAAGPYIHCG